MFRCDLYVERVGVEYEGIRAVLEIPGTRPLTDGGRDELRELLVQGIADGVVDRLQVWGIVEVGPRAASP